MDRTSIRAWRRIQKKRVWYKRLRLFYNVFAPAYIEDASTGEIREVESWKELRKVKCYQVYRTTSQPCSCMFCVGERYNRISFKRKTVSDIREQLEQD